MPDAFMQDNIKTPNIAVFNFTLEQVDRLKFPENIGSMLRGSFGHALRKLCCITDLPSCQHCPVQSHCRYPYLFEGFNNTDSIISSSRLQALVNPYIFRLHQRPDQISPKQTWGFSMVLMGQAVEDYPLIIKAWQSACETGFNGEKSANRSTARLIKVVNQSQDLYQEMSPKLPLVATEQIKCIPSLQLKSLKEIQKISLNFLTPFRLQYQGKIAFQPHQFDGKQLLINLYNRIQTCQNILDKGSVWQDAYRDFREFVADIEKLTITEELTSTKVVRHSSRQQQKITLFGLEGLVHLTGNNDTLTRLLPLLWLGQYLHVGKSTTLGLGQYQLQIHH